jgi:hypothetical protein
LYHEKVAMSSPLQVASQNGKCGYGMLGVLRESGLL